MSGRVYDTDDVPWTVAAASHSFFACLYIALHFFLLTCRINTNEGYCDKLVLVKKNMIFTTEI